MFQGFETTDRSCFAFSGPPAQSRHSEGSANGPVDLCNEREPFGLARAACFEQLACVFASCGANQGGGYLNMNQYVTIFACGAKGGTQIS